MRVLVVVVLLLVLFEGGCAYRRRRNRGGGEMKEKIALLKRYLDHEEKPHDMVDRNYFEAIGIGPSAYGGSSNYNDFDSDWKK